MGTRSTSRRVQSPKQKRRQAARPVPAWLYAAAAAGVAGLIAMVVVLLQDGERGSKAGSLPNTPDYHSLLVSPSDARQIVLGTHNGLFRSSDGGKTWQAAELGGQDAMNLARGGKEVVWAAGHNVLARSLDGGATWENVRPSGLPGLDVHGFAVDPRDTKTLYAAIAGQGLYRSTDGGSSFSPVSREVGPGVFALAVTPDGRLLAGEGRQGLMVSTDGGRSWRLGLQASLVGLALNPGDPQRILATGPGVLLSTDGGRSWRQVLELEEGAGPVAWSKSDPSLAYVVGFDRTLYRTADGGESWRPVA